jgi:FrmR/RcnR family transcriptional regulator, repressor of rcnA expression
VEIDRERSKLINRAKRIHGQMETVERSLIENRECTDDLMLLAAVKGGINGLMAEILEDHIRLHMGSGSRPMSPELGDELIDLVRAYLK